jgi:imidazolonepropionase-like amidohydrolase
MIPPILILLHLAGALAATRSATVQACLPGQPIAISGVEVLTLKDSLVGPRVTVLVDAGRIAAVGTPSIPANACRIDGTGRVLLPGLADMHAHTNERELPLFLANGVTLVRELNGSPAHLALREQIANGTVVGPRLVVGSPLLTGKALRFRHRLITSAEDARAAAREAKDAGYECLTIYDDLTAEQSAALAEAVRALGLPLEGHVPAAVGLERVLAAGQAIQHIDKIAFALVGHAPDSARLPEARRLFAGRRAWVTPTLASLRALDRSGTAEYAARFARPEMAYVDSGMPPSMVRCYEAGPPIARHAPPAIVVDATPQLDQEVLPRRRQRVRSLVQRRVDPEREVRLSEVVGRAAGGADNRQSARRRFQYRKIEAFGPIGRHVGICGLIEPHEIRQRQAAAEICQPICHIAPRRCGQIV